MEPVVIEHARVCHFKKKPNDPDTGKKRIGCARCGKAKYDPDHIGAPESFNVFASSGWQAYQSAKKRWHTVLYPLLEASDLPKGLGRIMVEGEATFPDRAVRDQGNHRVVLEKALGDTLTAGGWLEQDDWFSYEFGNLSHVWEPGVSRLRLILFPALERAEPQRRQLELLT